LIVIQGFTFSILTFLNTILKANDLNSSGGGGGGSEFFQEGLCYLSLGWLNGPAVSGTAPDLP